MSALRADFWSEQYGLSTQLSGLGSLPCGHARTWLATPDSCVILDMTFRACRAEL